MKCSTCDARTLNSAFTLRVEDGKLVELSEQCADGSRTCYRVNPQQYEVKLTDENFFQKMNEICRIDLASFKTILIALKDDIHYYDIMKKSFEDVFEMYGTIYDTLEKIESERANLEG